jgi:hypothetical protein
MAQPRNPFICYDGNIFDGPKIGDKMQDDAVRVTDRGPHGRVTDRAAHASESSAYNRHRQEFSPMSTPKRPRTIDSRSLAASKVYLAFVKALQPGKTSVVPAASKTICINFDLFSNENLNASGQVEAEPQPQPGDKMDDGTIYAGISPDTNAPMYTTLKDAPLTMKFNDAQEYAAKHEAHGHKDWRVPTKAELNVVFNNRAAIGGFDISGSDPAGWYWSSSQFTWWLASSQRFSDGLQFNIDKDYRSSVRPVR